MLKLLSYLLGQGVATSQELFPPLDAACIGMPTLTDAPCSGHKCNQCADVCPTQAIQVIGEGQSTTITLDRGSCIACGLCIKTCPTDTIVSDLSTKTAVRERGDLILSNQRSDAHSAPTKPNFDYIFSQALSIRVVSTGCSACDLEIGASGNPVFDMDRFGVQIVASPRFADALMVTGPVGKGMQKALMRCWEAMPEPKRVIAAGTCAISGGIHKMGYAEANGVEAILPVDVYIPGCPPHPWSIIHGVSLAMGKTV